MVVYIHGYYLEAKNYTVALFIQEIFDKGILSVANCLFFSISGYLFARNITSIKDVWKKQKKRFRTLLLPYILWNIIFILWYVLLAVVPGVSQFNNSSGMLESIFNQSLSGILYDIFIKPAAFQLWFLRDLIGMLIITPLLWYIAKNSWVSALLMAIASVYFYPWLIYFWLGIIISSQNWDIENYPNNKYIVALACLIFVGYAIAKACGLTPILYVNTFINLIGLYVVWSLYDVYSRGKCIANTGMWKFLCGFSFFIYCFHEPVFNIIKKLALHVFGVSETTLIIFYFINPWIMVFMAVIIARFIARYTPLIYKTLTGGR